LLAAWQLTGSNGREFRMYSKSNYQKMFQKMHRNSTLQKDDRFSLESDHHGCSS